LQGSPPRVRLSGRGCPHEPRPLVGGGHPRRGREHRNRTVPGGGGSNRSVPAELVPPPRGLGPSLGQPPVRARPPGGPPPPASAPRAPANVQAGGPSRRPPIVHGLLLLVSAVFIPQVLALIPLACLAAILIMIGYKLTKPALYVTAYRLGWDQFIPFVATVA